MKKEIAIIGFGRFGRCAAHHLRRHFRVLAADVRPPRKVERGVYPVSIATAARTPRILLGVPINQLPSVLKEISPCLLPGTLICDVCSVKEQPVRWMKQMLPRHVDILGLHPLFGPDSASASLRDRRIVISPVRIGTSRLRRVHTYLRREGLVLMTMTPARHDRLMASTLFLTQLVGRGLLAMNLARSPRVTQHHQFLVSLVQTAERDTRELFLDMYRYNRFARTIPEKIVVAFSKTCGDLATRAR